MKCNFDNFIPWLEVENIRDILLARFSMTDILDMYGIDYANSMSGNFTHRAICQFHKDGNESTPSFYLSNDTNSAYCFACQTNCDPIKFVSMYEGMPQQEVINKLAKLIGITKDTNIDDLVFVKKEKNDFRAHVEDNVFNSGIIIRDFVKSIEKEEVRKKAIKWAEKQFIDLDVILDEATDETSVDRAKIKYESIKNNINKLKSKYNT